MSERDIDTVKIPVKEDAQCTSKLSNMSGLSKKCYPLGHL